MSRDFSKMLNRSTPLAPKSEEEIAQRLDTPNGAPPEGAPQASPENREAHEELEPSEWDIFVPVREKPHRSDGSVLVQYEVRDLGEGQGAVPIYTTSEGLQEALGRFQPMVKVDVIEFLHQLQGRVPVVVNPTLQEGITRRTEELD
jgi:hypothetical protein